MEINEALPQYKRKRNTYADYCTWDDDERWELIDGVPYAMSPAPTIIHQTILVKISNQLYNFLEGKPCKVLVAPVDVRLNANSYDDTVVQPDIIVVCDNEKLDGKSCVGAPDLVIEILSPSTALKDKNLKFKKYLQAGVREYWIADPDSKTISAHILDNGRYYVTSYADTDTAPVHVLDGCTIDLAKAFSE